MDAMQSKVKQLTVRFLHRSVIYLTVLLISFLLFYFFGNFQGFLDESQLLLLRIISGCGLFLSLMCIFAFCFELYFYLRTKFKTYRRLSLISFFAFIFAVIISITGTVIIILSKGL
ncbi:hypothetical protein DWQ65_00700 [Treponema phagedenis]|nr:hypothetical protein HMPREF9554_03006 [Treponema phagedenis F0421]QSH94874.1 hypothetical protein C5O78_07440 [Treponema phagedenis]QSH98608.1 hypothetical protein DWQ65_00700 [Treponema phagedenis]